MVDNLAEKFDECLLNQGRKGLFAYNWASAIEGFLNYWSESKNSRDFYIMGVCCWGVSVKQGSTVVC